MLFSATLDGDVAVLTQRYQSDPVRHESEVQEDAPGDVEHVFWKVQRADRMAHAAEVITSTSPSIVFTRTRHGADRLARQFAGHGVTAVAMHGGRSQSQRTRALKDFSTGRAQALVATDVAARGIHVDGVASVVHFDPPEDEKAYLHRSGRTARAGATGLVVSLSTAPRSGAPRGSSARWASRARSSIVAEQPDHRSWARRERTAPRPGSPAAERSHSEIASRRVDPLRGQPAVSRSPTPS